jgi:kynureninase
LLAEWLANWADRLIRIWSENYIFIAQETGAKIAQLIGAQPDEVIVAESTSVNLFKLVVAALRMQEGRRRIVTDDLNFPSDIYILEGVNDLLGNQHHIQIVLSPDQIHGPVAGLEGALDSDTALLALSYTVFKSAYTYDMAAINEAAHKAGALVLWDLSHSVGSVPVDLNRSHADLAIGCTYKYLNIHTAITRMERIVKDKLYVKYSPQMTTVT